MTKKLKRVVKFMGKVIFVMDQCLVEGEGMGIAF